MTAIDGSQPLDPNRASVVTVSDMTFLEFPALEGFTVTNGIGVGTDSFRRGGGIDLRFVQLVVRNCVLRDNSATNGAAIYAFASRLELTDSILEQNTAEKGGGLYLFHSDATVLRTAFLENSATGGGFRSDLPTNAGGAVYAIDDVYVDFLQCRFERNQADFGGAFHSVAPFSIVGPTDVSFDSCLFLENSAAVRGGALYTEPPLRADIHGCTFFGNTASVGGGALCTCIEFPFTGYQRPRLTSSVLWQNQPDEIEGQARVDSCLVQGGFQGLDNLDANPGFVDPSTGNLALAPGSICIDRGSTGTQDPDRFDLAGSPRIVDGDRDGTATIDMGCYEYQPQPFNARLGSVNTADGGVNRADVLLLNGSAGDSERVVTVALNDPIQLDIEAPPSRQCSRYVVYAWIGEPDPLAVSVQERFGFYLGWTAFPTVFSGGSPQAVRLWNTFGHEPILGDPDFASDKAPTTLFALPNGRTMPITATFQGFVEDDAAPNEFGVATTNAVVLKVE